MNHTPRTLENYLQVALLEAEYWGTNVYDPLWKGSEEPKRLHELLLIVRDHDAMYEALRKAYGLGIPSEYFREGNWLVYCDCWLLIAADLEQRIAAVDAMYSKD